jgi:phage-related protein
MMRLHGFINKGQKVPGGDLDLAHSRKADLEH